MALYKCVYYYYYKSGTVWAELWGLALADFGRDPRISDSLRGSRNFVFCYSNNARFPSDKFYDIWTQRRRSVSPCKLSEQNFDKIPQEVVLKKLKNCSQHFQVLRFQAVITPQWLRLTDRRKFTSKWSLYGLSSFHFYCWNHFKVFPLGYTLRTRKVLTKIFGNVRWSIAY